VDRRSRVQPWRDVIGELVGIQSACAAWRDALPESFRDTATAEALQAIVDVDLHALAASSRRAVTAATDFSMVRPGARPRDDAGETDGLKGRASRRAPARPVSDCRKTLQNACHAHAPKKDQRSVLVSLFWPDHCAPGAISAAT
jgi:hypothetical protein